MQQPDNNTNVPQEKLENRTLSIIDANGKSPLFSFSACTAALELASSTWGRAEGCPWRVCACELMVPSLEYTNPHYANFIACQLLQLGQLLGWRDCRRLDLRRFNF